MKISILLPYKENFSPTYPGAVSLFVNDTSLLSSFKKKIVVYGNTIYKSKFKIPYVNLDLDKKIYQSTSKKYIENFIKIESQKKSDIIEIHNRPNYLKFLINKLSKRNFIIYFHNDPLSMNGSINVSERKFLLDNCYKILFNSNWSKKRFLEGMNNQHINSEKLDIVFQSAKKTSVNIKKKNNSITFVGKLNRSKGFDIFCKSIVKILDKYKNWNAIIIGDETRDKIYIKHNRVKKMGFIEHEKVLNIYKNSSIAVVCSRWEEPFGRTSLEAAANGCAVIISNRGGLPETITHGIILSKLNEIELFNKIEELILNKQLRIKLQKLSIKNFYLTHAMITKKIDNIRSLKLPSKFKLNKITKNKILRILHVTNFNEKHNGRLFFNTGRRLNNGFARLNHSILDFSDRDIQSNYKSINDINGSKVLNEKLINTAYNYKPDLLVLGHADLITPKTLSDLKDNYPNLKIAQWFLDPLSPYAPDYEKNKQRILHKSEFIDANFVTTSPDVLPFLPKDKINCYIPNPADKSFETLENFNNDCNMDLFFALSHGVHRGKLKSGKYDNREMFF